MFYQSSIKNLSQSSLNSAPLRELVVTLNEQTEELLSGGAVATFERSKPHDNIGFGGSSGSSPYEGCDPGTCC